MWKRLSCLLLLAALVHAQTQRRVFSRIMTGEPYTLECYLPQMAFTPAAASSCRLRAAYCNAAWTAARASAVPLDIVSAFQSYGEFLSGAITEQERREIVCNSCPGAGACGGM